MQVVWHERVELTASNAVPDGDKDTAPSNAVPRSEVFQLVSLIAVLVSALCVVSLVLSSRHLYANKFFPKMPVFASASWFVSCLCLWFAATSHDVTIVSIWSYLSWTTDVSARSLLLWFTYIRTATLWPAFSIIKYTAVAIQLVQAVSFAFVLYVTSPDKQGQSNSEFYKQVVMVYSLTDMLPVLLDVALIDRLWTLKLRLVAHRASNPFSRIKLMFFHFAVICIVLVMGISATMATLTILGNDPYYCFASILFTFRILLTDVFSNLIRDSLIEKHSTDLIQASREATSRPTPPPPPATSPMHDDNKAAADGGIPRQSVMTVVSIDAPPPTLIESE